MKKEKKFNKVLEKYNISAPRYTSFPAVPFWKTTPSEDKWFKTIRYSLGKDNLIDLYIHIPFCESLCYYCGCFKTITKNKTRGEEYVDLILKEWSIYRSRLGEIKINSVHLGGGSPNFLSDDALEKLLHTLAFDFSSHFVGACEIDPRTCTHGFLKILKKFNMLRLSMGIQDFDPKVQKAINRLQSVNDVTDLVSKVRELNFSSLNFDLIHGLPYQTEKSIKNTIDHVLKLDPSMIAFYSYAHLPSSIPSQKLIPEESLPSGSEKRNLYEIGKHYLEERGFIEIGLDHFAKKDSYLAKASEEKRLQRSFMGYTDKKESVTIGLGVSSISSTPLSFLQNTKDLKEYKNALMRDELAILKGHLLSDEEQSVAELIQDWMCNGECSLAPAQALKDYDQMYDELSSMALDGLLKIEGNRIISSELGRPYLRNVAKVFDVNLRAEKASSVQFSRTI